MGATVKLSAVVILGGEQQVRRLADDRLVARFERQRLAVADERRVGEARQVVGIPCQRGHGRDGIAGEDAPPERRAGGIVFHPESDLHLLDPVEQIVRLVERQQLIGPGRRLVIAVHEMAVRQLGEHFLIEDAGRYQPREPLDGRIRLENALQVAGFRKRLAPRQRVRRLRRRRAG